MDKQGVGYPTGCIAGTRIPDLPGEVLTFQDRTLSKPTESIVCDNPCFSLLGIAVVDSIPASMTGPHPAFLVQGDDELGALVDIHGALYDGDINVVSLTGVTSGQGDFGYPRISRGPPSS